MIAPRAHDELRVFCRLHDRGVVSAAYRIVDGFQGRGISRAPAEDVGNDERAEAPALGVVARARTRRVELELVRGTGIEHEEIRDRLRLVPAAPQEVAPAPATRELGARRRHFFF